MEQHKEKLEEAKKLYESANDDQKHVLESLFPELKESEDEVIKKKIIALVKSRLVGLPQGEKYVAWLEKQSESDETKAKMFLIKKGYPIDANGTFPTYKEMCNIIRERLKKIAETSIAICDPDAYRIGFADGEAHAKVVKPKFDIDDWIIHKGTKNVYKIVAIINNKYQLKYGDNYTVQKCVDVDECARLWTIRDAKAGDVLVYKGNIKYTTGTKYERIYLFNNLNEAFFTLTKTSYGVKGYNINVNIDYPDNTVPATKEQKEILFKTMANAGYTFDFKKKELKKIEQVHAKWSEEAPAKAEFADYE